MFSEDPPTPFPDVIATYPPVYPDHIRGVDCAPPPAMTWTCEYCGTIFNTVQVEWTCVVAGTGRR